MCQPHLLVVDVGQRQCRRTGLWLVGAWGLPAPSRRIRVGPNPKTNASDGQPRGAPTGAPRLTRRPPNPRPNPGHPPAQPVSHPCGFPGCERVFSTKTGRGVHMRSAHPDWLDDAIRASGVKIRWTDEEVSLLARREAELTVKGGVRFMNQALIGFLPDRTLDSIKSARKREAYRVLVMEHIGRIQREAEAPAVAGSSTAREVEECDRALLEYFRGLSPLGVDGFRATTLDEICARVGMDERGTTLEKLTAYLAVTFPPPRTAGRAVQRRRMVVAVRLSKRQRRRVDYGRAQKLWRRDPRRCLDGIIDGPGASQSLPKEVMVPYWESLMTRANDSAPPPTQHEETISSLWLPVLPDEVREALPERKTAPGPDGLSARILRKIPLEILRRIYNLIMWCRRLPIHLRDSRTVLLPKVPVPTGPSDYRPISVASTLVRGLHKVLAKRMGRLIRLDDRQRAFRATDGCADNVFLLDLVLRYFHAHHRPLYIASVDVAKAFDTVSHRSILQTLRARGCPAPMLQYMESVYSDALTTIVSDGWQSHAIHPMHGVRQGDPMSPYIFNMVLDRLLKSFPQDIGVNIDGVRIGAAAFADDLILAASTKVGLQQLLDRAESFLASCGMSVNVGKSFTVSLGTVPRQKKTTVDVGNFTLGGRRLVAMKRTDSWKYLGIPFTPEGRLRSDPSVKLVADLDKISSAPLKPQQRLFALRVYLLPGLYYAASLGAVRLGTLNRCDRAVRAAVRKWLDLPGDTPTAYFHANVDSGGLGVPSLRWSIPRLRLNRLNKLNLASAAASGQPGEYLRLEIGRAVQNLTDRGELIDTSVKEARRWAEALYRSVDGGALKESKRVRGQNRWVAEGTRFLSGKDFLQSCKLRINALPTKSRTSRGRGQDRLCRANCGVPETLNHVLQQCSRTHDVRIKRHDAVVSYLARGLEQNGFRVLREPRYRTDVGDRKPDLVVAKDSKCMVIDAQVVSEQSVLDLAHKDKVKKYSDNASLRRAIALSHRTEDVSFYTATLSWRGLWSKKSVRGLLEAGLMNVKDVKVISSRVLVGGFVAWKAFNRRTAMRIVNRRTPAGDRTGVG